MPMREPISSDRKIDQSASSPGSARADDHAEAEHQQEERHRADSRSPPTSVTVGAM